MSEREHTVLKVTSRVFREEISAAGIVPFIEDLVAEERGFPIYQRLHEQLDEDGFPIIPNPLLTYCGSGTLPLLAHPISDVGAIAVVIGDKKLVFDPKGPPPHDLRDNYLWSFSPYDYYIDPNQRELLKLFKKAGYSLWESTDSWQFGMAVFHGQDFALGPRLDNL